MIVDTTARTPRRRAVAGARGFTLVEMMLTILIASILMMLAVPSFNDAALGAKVSAIANDLYASVQLARSEAIKRNIPITLCRSTNGTSCAAASDWATGWIVIDTASSTVFKYQQAEPTGFKVTQSGTAANLAFQPIGVGATAATFTVCRSSPVGKQERVVTISATGVAYVTATETGTCP